MRDLALLLGCLAMLPLALRHAHVGVMLWAWTAFLAPADRVWGFMATVPLNKLFAAVTLLALLYDRQARRPYLDPTLALMLAMLPLGLLSSLHSISDSPELWEMFGKTVKVAALCVVVSMVMTSRQRIHGLLLAVAAGLGLSGVWEGLAFAASGGGHRVQGLSTIGDNNQFALAMLMLLPILLHLYRQSAGGLARLGLLGAFALTAVSVVAAFSRGGFIGLVVLAAGLVAAGRHRLATTAVLGVLGLALAALAPEAWFERINTIGEAGQDASFNERVGAWKMAVLLALDHPLLGGGFHALQNPSVWASYLPMAQFSDLITSEPVLPTAHAAHSIYLEVLSDLGFPGLALFLSLMAVGLWNGQAVKRLAAGDPRLAWAADLAFMLQMCVVVYAVSGAALSMAYFELFYLVLALLSGLRRNLAGDQQHLAGQRAQAQAPDRQVPA